MSARSSGAPWLLIEMCARSLVTDVLLAGATNVGGFTAGDAKIVHAGKRFPREALRQSTPLARVSESGQARFVGTLDAFSDSNDYRPGCAAKLAVSVAVSWVPKSGWPTSAIRTHLVTRRAALQYLSIPVGTGLRAKRTIVGAIGDKSCPLVAGDGFPDRLAEK